MRIRYFIPTCFIIIAFLIPHPISGENAESPSIEQSSFTSYGDYEEKEEEFVPTRISYIKLLTFPILAVGTPITFTTYYIFTKEPKLGQSFSNYWRSIYFNVPYDVDSIADQKITFPKKYPQSEEEKKRIRRFKEARKHLQKARKYYDKKKYEKAIHEYNIVLDLDPENEKVPAMIEKISDELEAQKEEQLIKKEAKEQVRNKKEVQKLLQRGEKYYKKKKYEEALREYNKVINLDTKNEDAQKMIKTISKEQQSQKEEALRKQKEKEVQQLFQKGESYYKKKHYDRALLQYNKILEHDPKNEQAQKMIKTISNAQQSQKEEELRQQKEEEQKRVKKEIEELLKRGDKYYKKKKLEEALDAYNNVLTIDKKNEHALKMIETISEMQRLKTIESTIESEKKKIERKQKSKELLKEDNHIQQVMTRTVSEAKKGDEERSDVMRLQSLLNAGREEFDKKNYERARSLYKQVLRYYPENEEAKTMVEKITDMLHEQERKEITKEKGLYPLPETKMAEKAINNLICNGDFELWSKGISSAPDAWEERKEGVIYAQVDSRKLGSYGLRMVGTGSVAYLTYQSIKDYANYAKKTLTASCWVKTVGKKVNLRLDDGSITNGQYHSGSGDWELLSVTKTISATPSKLRLAIAQPLPLQKDEVICDGALLVEGDKVVEFSPHPSDSSSKIDEVHVPFL